MKIVFIGAAGSGKTTLAAQVFAALKVAGRNAEIVEEWVRAEIQRRGPMMSIWEQYRTRQYQKELEDAIPAEVKYVICDSGTLSPYFYAAQYVDPNRPRQRIVLQDMYRYLLDDLYLRRYDLIFYLPLMSHALDDDTRFQTEEEVKLLDDHMKLLFTKIHRLPELHPVQSAMEHRLEEVMWKILAIGESSLSADQLREKVIDLVNRVKKSGG